MRVPWRKPAPFRPKTALITGAGSGLGEAMAMALALRGTNVFVADSNIDAARAVSRRIGDRAEAVRMDVRIACEIEAAVELILARHGQIDCLINCAGITSYGEALDITLERWTDIISVNLLGTVLAGNIAYRVMARQGHGTIINMGSMAVFLVDPLFSPYTTAKFGVVGFTRSLGIEAEARGVHVCAVCPGNIRTPLQVGYTLSRFTPSTDVAAAARKILMGVEKRRRIIVFPFHPRLFWWLDRIHPNFLDPIRREILRRARLRNEAGKTRLPEKEAQTKG